MQTVTLTNHARKRIQERCVVSDEELKRLLEAGAGVVIHLLKGGRYVQRLVYSPKDDDWFMVAQAVSNGVILTVMPLSFLQGRVDVTAQVKRQARRRALDAAKSISAIASTTVLPEPIVNAPEPAAIDSVEKATGHEPTTITASAPIEAVEPPVAVKPALRIRVRYRTEGRTQFKNLPRVPREFGSPATWTEAGPIHPWLKEQLIAANIPFAAIESIFANHSNAQPSQLVDFLLEHLPLTEEEIACCR